MTITGQNLIAGEWSGKTEGGFKAFNAQTHKAIDIEFSDATELEVNTAIVRANEAFATYGQLTAQKRATFLRTIGEEICYQLKFDFNVAYDEKEAIGRRYRRQDANGTPFCIAVVYQSKEDNTVTIRHRDTMAQERVKIEDLRKIIKQEVDVRSWLMKM